MDSLTGRALGPYQILERLSTGGMATIYKAYHAAMDRSVAIKVLPQQLAHNDMIRARFQREVRTIARLEHRYILPVYDVGEYEGVSFLVMRFIDSGTLSDLIAGGSLSLERALNILGQVGEALAYAHRQGVIHRDIKPHNILIDREGNALLSDFGIAKIIIEGTLELTGEGSLIGTPYYMAPEQVNGQPIDGRADLYALGVVLYEAVTGRRPFVADTPMSVALLHVQAPLPPPRQFNPSLPEAVEQMIVKALEKDPAARYQTADELVNDLHRASLYSQREATVTTAPSDITQVDQSLAGNWQQPLPEKPAPADDGRARLLPIRTLLGGAAVLALIALLLLVVLPALGNPIVISQSGETATPAPITPSAAPPTEAPPTNTLPAHTATLEPTVPPTPQRPLGTIRWRFQASKPLNTTPVFAGGLVFAGGDDDRLYALDSASGEERWSFAAGSAIYSAPAVDGGVLYFGSWDGHLYAVDAASGEKRWQYRTNARIWASPAVGADTVYISSDDFKLHAVDVPSGEQRWTYPTKDGLTGAPLLADGTVYVGGQSGLYAIDAQTGVLRWLFQTPAAVRSRPVIADGVVYAGCDDGHVYAIDAQTSEELDRFATGDRVWSQPAVGGDLIYFGSWDQYVYAIDRTTREERWKVEMPDKVASSPVLSDGVLYIGGDAGSLYALDAESGQELWSFKADGRVSTPLLSDGTIYVTTSAGSLYALR